MLKYLLIGVLVIWLLYSPLLRQLRQAQRERRSPPPPAPEASRQVEEMVACARCGVHLPSSDAVRDAAHRPYCSVAHRDAGPSSH